MSISNLAYLGALRLQAQQRSDLENNPAVSTQEWNQYISQSYKELYDLLVASYGDEYEFALPYQFNLTQAQFYNLPDGSATYLAQDASICPAFYKLCGVDLQYSGSPTGWVSLKKFNFIDRNKYAYPNSTINTNGQTNLKYRVMGNQLMLVPIPCAGQAMQIWYAPAPTSLTFWPSCATTSSSAVVTVSDVRDLAVGMSCTGPGVATGVTISSINIGANQVTLSAVVTATQPVVILQFWIDSAVVNGVSGWEEFIVIDAAIKASIKVENNIVEGLMAQKMAMKERIEGMAHGRDAGQAEHVSDLMSVQGDGGMGSDGGWFGGQGGGW